MKCPVFTIITVTYNAAAVLENTIRSITEQTWPGIEYLVVDGGSTDGTVDLIHQYEEKITAWVSEPDKGIYDAMNKGLKMATGDYVWFINAGDILPEPTIVEQIGQKLEGLHSFPDVIYGETKIINRKGEIMGDRRLKAPERLTWKSFRWGMLVCHQSFIPKREIVPFYDTHYRFSADYKWCIECLKKAKEIYNTHLYLSFFLDEGTTSQNRKASLKERYDIMCRYYGKIQTSLFHLWFAVRFYTARWIMRKV